MKLLLSNWGGFTELHMPHKGWNINWSPSVVTDPLPSKTNSDLALKFETRVIFESMFWSYAISIYPEVLNISDNPLIKNIKSKADEIAKSFSKLPNNIKPDSSSLDPYVSHLNAFMDMTNSKTGESYNLYDYYILALMLINEALRLKGEEAIAPAIEAMRVCSMADQYRRWKEFEQESKKKLADARHGKDRKVSKYIEILARDAIKKHPKLNATDIANLIEPDVLQKAKFEGFEYKKSYSDIIYKVVLAIFKNNRPPK